MKIIDMSEDSLLEGLIEECSELIQAAAKRLRIMRGESPTPVTLAENEAHLIEELADAELNIQMIVKKLGAQSEVDTIYLDKLKRWEKRLKEKEAEN